jgi:hypothetical protein
VFILIFKPVDRGEGANPQPPTANAATGTESPQFHCGQDRRVGVSAPHQNVPLRQPGHRLDLIGELKRRNIARVAVLYMLTCWAALGPLHLLLVEIDVGAAGDSMVRSLMIVGFPAVLLFAWVFEWTAEGLKPSAEVDRRRSDARLAAQRLDWAIVAVVAIALAGVVIDKFSA